jgi:hypothetical protein
MEPPRDFIKKVLMRMRKPSGLPTEDKTAEGYTIGVHRMQTLCLFHQMTDPDKLYEILKQKFDKAPTIITLLRSSMMFIGNLTQEERTRLNLEGDIPDILQRYRKYLTECTARRKVQQEERKRAGLPGRKRVSSKNNSVDLDK